MKNYFKYISLTLAALLFAVFATGLYFLYKQIYINNEKSAQVLMDIDNENSRREEIKLINRSIDTIKKDRDLISTHFAERSDVVPFLNTIESLAPKVGARAETSSVDVLKDNSGLAVRLNVEGSFSSIYRFLMLLENSAYELDFSNIVIQKKSSTEITTEGVPVVSKTPEWQAVFNIKLLSFIP